MWYTLQSKYLEGIILLINTPHNPTGKVFTLEEMESITKVLDEFPNVVVVADEVYEWLTYD